MLLGKPSERYRQGESHQEVRHGQEKMLLLGEPGLSCHVLAGGTVAIAAGVIPVLGRRARWTGIDMVPQCRGATLLNCHHDGALVDGESITQPRTIAPEDLSERDHTRLSRS